MATSRIPRKTLSTKEEEEDKRLACKTESGFLGAGKSGDSTER